MSDIFRRVRPGEPLNIPARTFNAFVDAAEAHRNRQHDQRVDGQGDLRQTGIVHVRNSSGAARARFEVLGIDGPLIPPDDNENEFAGRVALDGVTPTEDHRGKFVVLLEPLADGKIGKGVVSGVTAARVNVQAAADGFADIKPTEHILHSGKHGAASILWKEEGTGEKWAIVLMDGDHDDGCLVKITGNASGGGKYNGRILGRRTTDVSASGNLTEAEMGTLPGADDALVLNSREVGKSTHDLETGASVRPHTFLGRIIRTNADGKKVVVIDGAQWEDCE